MQANESEAQTNLSENSVDKINESKVNTESGSDTNNENQLLDKIETTNEFIWDAYGYHYVGLVLKNNTASTIRLDSEFIFYDKENKIIGSKKESYPAFEASSNILLYISNEDPFDHYECILNPSIDNYLSPINSQLKSEVNETDNKLIFSITNTGNSKAQFVKCTVLFFKEGKVVSNTYAFAGTNGTIESGSTERAEIKKTLNKPYDEYKVFIDGHSSASNNSLPTAETNTVEAETEKVSEDLGLNPLLKNQFSIEDVMNGFNTDKIGEYGIVSIDKETLKNITQDQFKEFIDKKVIDSGLNWVSIICSDNTAIIFNGSNHQIATYGECSNDGIVTKPLGYLMLTTDGYEYQEATE